MHIIITGGSSYIGRRLVQIALQRGHGITLLGNDPGIPGMRRAIPWRLGQPVPELAWAEPVDAIIHLAHVWHTSGPEDDDINLSGTADLLATSRRAGVSRFLFASSLSARMDGLNRYGRVKFRTEALLTREGETAVRIGLVYGGPQQSLWGVLCRISALPLLPVIGPRQPVQPIHLDDVADGLLRIAVSGDTPPRKIILAGTPVTFARFLREIAWRRHRLRPLLVPMPLAPLLGILNVMVKLGLPLQGVRERVLGLAGVTVQSGDGDAARLGLSLRPFVANKSADGDHHRERAIEAAAYLRYVLGRPANQATLRRYLRGWRLHDFGATVVPSMLRRCPPLLRIAEPMPWDQRPRAQVIRSRLHAATVLAETDIAAGGKFYAMTPQTSVGSWLRLVAFGTAEAVLLLPRAIIGYWLWR